MVARRAEATSTAGRVLVLTRVFDAPRELVFKAWTDPEHAAHWWGPQGMAVTIIQMDVRPGGVWSRRMRAPDGAEYWPRGVYKEVVPPERLAFTYVTADIHGKPGHETLVTLTFEELGAKTRLTLHQADFASVKSRDSHQGGWTSCLERFADYLARGPAKG